MTLCKIAILFALASAEMFGAGPWTITKVVDNTTACPGGTGTFNPASLFPAINGPWVVFLDAGDDNCTANNGQSIWSYNLITKALVKLVDTSTAIPEGVGNFVGLAGIVSDNLQVHDGTVLFYGYGSGYNPTNPNCAGGLYTVSVAGGKIFRTVDYTMTLPGYGGSFCALNSYGVNGVLGMSLDKGEVLFSASAVGAGFSNSGVWRAPANVNTKESDLHLIADGSTVYQSPFPAGCSPGFCQTISQWTEGFVGAAGLVFTGGGETSADGLFLNSPSTPILLSSYILPGDTAHDVTHPDNASYYIGPVVDGANIFFSAADPFYQGTCANGGGSGIGTFMGVYMTGLAGGTATSIMNTCSKLPNGDAVGSNSFYQVAADQAIAAFPVQDSTTGNYVLAASVDGALSQILAPGNPLPSGVSCSGAYHAVGCTTGVSPAGTGGVSGGRVVFVASGGPYWYDEGVYLASLACAANLTSDVSVALGTLTYDSTTKTWSQTATVTNTGQKAIGPLSLILTNLTSGVTLTNRAGSTVCLAPEGSPYINLYPSGHPLAVGGKAQVTLTFSDPSNAGIAFTSKVAGEGAR